MISASWAIGDVPRIYGFQNRIFWYQNEMPRKARIDAPGALHHIIVRGINRRKIFFDDPDRDDFLDRLGDILSDCKTPCFAWAFMTNHLHLLLRTGTAPIATVMRRLLTEYQWINQVPLNGSKDAVFLGTPIKL